MAEVRAPAPASSPVASPRPGGRSFSTGDRIGAGIQGGLDILLNRRAEIKAEERTDAEIALAAKTRSQDLAREDKAFTQDVAAENQANLRAMLPFAMQFQQENPGAVMDATMFPGASKSTIANLNSMFEASRGTGERIAAEGLEDRGMTAAEHTSGLATGAQGRAESEQRIAQSGATIGSIDANTAGTLAENELIPEQGAADLARTISLTAGEDSRTRLNNAQAKVFKQEFDKQIQIQDSILALNAQALEAGALEKQMDELRIKNSRTPEELILFDAQVAAMEDNYARVGTLNANGEPITAADAARAMDSFAEAVSTMKAMAAGNPDFNGFLNGLLQSGFSEEKPADSDGKSAMDLFKEGPVGAAGSIVRGEANTILGEGSVGAPATTTGEGNRFEIIR